MQDLSLPAKVYVILMAKIMGYLYYMVECGLQLTYEAKNYIIILCFKRNF